MFMGPPCPNAKFRLNPVFGENPRFSIKNSKKWADNLQNRLDHYNAIYSKMAIRKNGSF